MLAPIILTSAIAEPNDKFLTVTTSRFSCAHSYSILDETTPSESIETRMRRECLQLADCSAFTIAKESSSGIVCPKYDFLNTFSPDYHSENSEKLVQKWNINLGNVLDGIPVRQNPMSWSGDHKAHCAKPITAQMNIECPKCKGLGDLFGHLEDKCLQEFQCNSFMVSFGSNSVTYCNDHFDNTQMEPTPGFAIAQSARQNSPSIKLHNNCAQGPVTGDEAKYTRGTIVTSADEKILNETRTASN